jgi:hypothetical protein
MMSAGVPAGASRPAEKVSASSGKPLSTMVGTSGKSLLRTWVVTASARTLPCWISGSSVAVVPKFIWMRPPSISVMACAPPL